MPYDDRFLGPPVEPPRAPASVSGEDAPVLTYTHFSLAMNPDRRLAWWVAWNIDGLRLFPSDDIPRSGENFRLDVRLPAEHQTGEEVYADNPLDRGHLARRSDLLWGTPEEARAANTDSFTFTNIAPQLDTFNQSMRGGVWGRLENAVLALDDLAERRLSLFAGPVLATDDLAYRGVLVPREYWKIVVYRRGDRPAAKAFVLSQDLDSGDLEDILDDFTTFEIGLDALGARTGLDLTGLADLAAAARRRSAPDAEPRPIRNAEDVAW